VAGISRFGRTVLTTKEAKTVAQRRHVTDYRFRHGTKILSGRPGKLRR
jgi:hypothetical protein